MLNERAHLAAVASAQGGFTDEQWTRYCEIADTKMAPVIAAAKERFRDFVLEFCEKWPDRAPLLNSRFTFIEFAWPAEGAD